MTEFNFGFHVGQVLRNEAAPAAFEPWYAGPEGTRSWRAAMYGQLDTSTARTPAHQRVALTGTNDSRVPVTFVIVQAVPQTAAPILFAVRLEPGESRPFGVLPAEGRYGFGVRFEDGLWATCLDPVLFSRASDEIRVIRQDAAHSAAQEEQR